MKMQFSGNQSQISQKYIKHYKPGPERHHEVAQPSQFPQNAWPAGSTRISGPGRPQAVGPAWIFGRCYSLISYYPKLAKNV